MLHVIEMPQGSNAAGEGLRGPHVASERSRSVQVLLPPSVLRSSTHLGRSGIHPSAARAMGGVFGSLLADMPSDIGRSRD